MAAPYNHERFLAFAGEHGDAVAQRAEQMTADGLSAGLVGDEAEAHQAAVTKMRTDNWFCFASLAQAAGATKSQLSALESEYARRQWAAIEALKEAAQRIQ